MTLALRMGIVEYLNALPLTHFIDDIFPEAEVKKATPAELEQMLIEKRVDIALVSSITYARYYPDFHAYTRIGIAAHRQVQSVNLFWSDTLKSGFPEPFARRFDPNQRWTLTDLHHVLKRITIIKTDPASRTSNAMIRVLMDRSGFRNISLVSPDGPEIPSLILRIGDQALLRRKSGPYIDLARWWHLVTGRPFVFALWTGPASLPWDQISVRLAKTLEHGLSNLPLLIAEHIELYPILSHLSSDELYIYLSKIVQYRLHDEYRRSLLDYYDGLYMAGLIKKPIPEVP